MDAVRDQLLSVLRKLAPHKVRVYSSDDEHRDVAVPTRRKKWTQVIDTIERIAWTRCELLAKDGALLGVIDNEAGEPEELVPERGAMQYRWFLELMIKGQQVALSHRDKEHTELLAGMREVMAAQTHAMRELVGLFAVQRDVAADIAAMKATAEAGGDWQQIAKIIEESPKLMQMLTPLLGALLRGNAPKKIAPPAGAKP